MPNWKKRISKLRKWHWGLISIDMSKIRETCRRKPHKLLKESKLKRKLKKLKGKRSKSKNRRKISTLVNTRLNKKESSKIVKNGQRRLKPESDKPKKKMGRDSNKLKKRQRKGSQIQPSWEFVIMFNNKSWTLISRSMLSITFPKDCQILLNKIKIWFLKSSTLPPKG